MGLSNRSKLYAFIRVLTKGKAPMGPVLHTGIDRTKGRSRENISGGLYTPPKCVNQGENKGWVGAK
jgi:hypothetical protein